MPMCTRLSPISGQPLADRQRAGWSAGPAVGVLPRVVDQVEHEVEGDVVEQQRGDRLVDADPQAQHRRRCAAQAAPADAPRPRPSARASAPPGSAVAEAERHAGGGDAADDELALAADVDQPARAGTVTASAARMIGVASTRISPIESQLRERRREHVGVGVIGLTPLTSMKTPKITRAAPNATSQRPTPLQRRRAARPARRRASARLVRPASGERRRRPAGDRGHAGTALGDRRRLESASAPPSISRPIS